MLRSIHATHSLAALGSYAKELCSDHYRQDTPCGAATPYARLLQRPSLGADVRGDVSLLYSVSTRPRTRRVAHTRMCPETLDRLRVIDEKGESAGLLVATPIARAVSF